VERSGIMVNTHADASPRLKARSAGVVYLLAGLTSVIGGMYIPGRFVVAGDAAKTANAILAHPNIFELGFSIMLAAVAFSIILTVLFYDLFRPVNRSLSLAAAFFHLVGLAILGVASLLQLAPLITLEAGQYLSAFKLEQVQALSYLFLELNTQTTNTFLAFFGIYCILIGYLIFRSTFLPHIIGMFMGLAGLGYLAFLSPSLANYLSPYNLAPAALGEGSFMLWLIVVGVNAERWTEQASGGSNPERHSPDQRISPVQIS
jgi:hypothetical protein